MELIRLIDFKNANNLTYKGMEADLNNKWSYSCIQKYATNALTIPDDFIEKVYEVYGVHIEKEYSTQGFLKNQYDDLQDKYNHLLQENASLRKFNIKICTEVVTDKAFKNILKESSYQGKFNEDIYRERRKYYEELMFGHTVSDSTVTPYDFQVENVLLNLTCKKCKHYNNRSACNEHINIIQECKCRQLACDLIEENTDLECEPYFIAEDTLTKEIASGQFKNLEELKRNHPDIFTEKGGE